MRKIQTTCALPVLCLAAVALAGCQGIGARQPAPVAVAAPAPVTPTGPVVTAPPTNTASALNGRWLPTDESSKGVYVAEFRDGTFVSRAPGSQDALARGSYRNNGDRVTIDYVGAASQTAATATCERRSGSELYCVPTVGSPFNLRRA